jgi:hypothetical protein
MGRTKKIPDLKIVNDNTDVEARTVPKADKYLLTPEEQETTARFSENRLDKLASVFTHNYQIKKKLNTLLDENNNFVKKEAQNRKYQLQWNEKFELVMIFEDGRQIQMPNNIILDENYDNENNKLWGSLAVLVPKKWISIRPPKKMNLTEEQKKASSERMKNIASKKLD